MNDSTLFNPEAYSKFFRKILFIKSPAKISDEEREAIIHRIPDVETFNMEPETLAGLQAMDSDKLRDIIQNYKIYGYDKGIQLASLSILKSRGAEINDIIDKQDKRHIDAAESLYNTSSRLTIAAYVVFIILFATKLIGIAAILIYVPFYARSMMYYSTFYKDIKSKSVWYHVIIGVLSFTIYPLIYFFVKKEMDKDKKELEIIKFS
jgi:lipopolysaccharide export system permease protein